MSEHGRCCGDEGGRRWYVVFCKPRQEFVAHENLTRQDYDVYLPRLQTRQRRHSKWRDVIEVLFPRYLFVQVDPAQRSTAPIRSTRGVIDLVRFGGQLAKVPNEVIAALLRREDQNTGLHQEDCLPFKAGDTVRLAEGPLAGMEGVFAQRDGAGRAVMLVEFLGRTNRLFVNRDWLARAA